MWRRVALTVTLVLLPVSLLAYGLRSDPRAVPAPLVGKTAPEFRLPALPGASTHRPGASAHRGDGDVALADLRGRVLVLNFWASWCGPCRAEAPELEAVWERYRSAGVVILGVNIQDREAAARAFLAETRTTFANVVDASGATSIAYGIYGVPETFVIDGEGRIRFRHVGAIRAETLVRQIEPLLVARR
jgi:cytochrome c biogenesis protein CcmG/thiol:disulfide interchange protein DsbE